MQAYSSYVKDLKDLGRHEDYLTKIGAFQSNGPVYRVSAVNGTGDFKPTLLIDTNEEVSAKTGHVLGSDIVLKTNNYRVELNGNDGSIIRLAPNSEFWIESNTVLGARAVIYGSVFTFYTSKVDPIQSIKKYVTSCWSSPEMNYIEPINETTDRYVSFFEPVSIYEYDEQGIKFHIATLNPFEELEMEFNKEKPMRERYNVVSRSPLSHNLKKKIFEDFFINF